VDADPDAPDRGFVRPFERHRLAGAGCGGGTVVSEVACVHRHRRIAVTEDGQELSVTVMLDRFGDETDEVDEAVSCVAGPDKDGLWLQIDLSAFDAVAVH
jgi:hypothetical protein